MKELEFLEEVEKLGINITEDQKEKLREYASFLLEYNKYTNLTAIKTRDEVYLKHFYDSITLVKIEKFENQKILDIGTGAGFPGIVLAVLFPNTKMFLLDSNHKKIDFLNLLVKRLNLENVTTIYDRAENYVKKHREEFDIVTSRAVAELRILVELSLPALKIGGSFLGMKGNITEERNEARETISLLGGSIIKELEFNLLKDTGKRTLIKIEKKETTPKEYPREYRLIVKKALKKK